MNPSETTTMNCPQCRESIRVFRRNSGKRLRCPSCRLVIVQEEETMQNASGEKQDSVLQLSERITYTCPECNAKLAVDSQHAGKKLKCPKCFSLIPVPDNDPDNLSFLVDDDLPPNQTAKSITRKTSDEEEDYEDDDDILCPKCESRHIHAEKRGWSFWYGFIGSGTIVLTCLKCGHRFYPGEG
jgi:DNA-directed RNA polymerase subunit M/transcription elongation factor TFIIS